jgi:hypothetical protein
MKARHLEEEILGYSLPLEELGSLRASGAEGALGARGRSPRRTA